MPSYLSPRVSQLDAYILDSELLSLLKQNLVSIFHLHNSKWWTYDQHPELWDLMLNALVFRLTTWKSGSSYGLSLQNLKLVNFRSGKPIGYTKRSVLFAFIVGDYLFSKFQSYLYSASDDTEQSSFKIILSIKAFIIRHKDLILMKINNTLRLLNLANFALFLVSGRYPSLVHRVLGISLSPIVGDLLRFNGDNVNFEFQNRQLVWNVMTEFLVFILPLLQLKKLSKMSKRLLLPYRKESLEKVDAPFQSLPVSQCAICHDKKEKAVMAGEKKFASVPCMVTNPYITNCGHIYCYICIASAFNAVESSDAEDKCLRCNNKLEWFKKYGENDGDIDQDAIMVEYTELEVEEEEEVHDLEDEDEKQQEARQDSESERSSDDASSLDEFDEEEAFDEDGGVDEDEYDEDDEAMEL